MTRKLRVLLVLLLGVLLSPRHASAWPHSPLSQGVNIGSASSPSAPASDGLGGCFVATTRYSGSYQLYAQHYDASGNALWGSGVAVSLGSGHRYTPLITPDGQGGCLIAWYDGRTSATTATDIYAQRLSANGSPLWTANGVAVCTATSDQYPIAIENDGQGGAWLAWNDLRSTTQFYAYIQHLNSVGTATLALNGLSLENLSTGSYNPSLAVDMNGYAIVAWTDYRATSSDIYAQHLTPTGTLVWGTNGAAVCAAANTQADPQVVLFGDGSAGFVWTDSRGADADIYAQRFASNGFVFWTANGIPVCSAIGNQTAPQITLDAGGYAVATWLDQRTSDGNIYAQRIGTTGAMQWTSNGVSVRTAPGTASAVFLVSDGVSGTIAAWSDTRNDVGDLYAQRLSASGYPMWTTNGALVASGPREQRAYGIAPTSSGGTFLTSQDGATALSHLQVVDEWGFMGAEPSMAGVKDVPNDQGGRVRVSWNASPLDTDPLFRNISDYVVYRSIPTHLAATLARVATHDAVTYGGKHYVRTHTSAQDYYWEELAHVTPRHLSGYSFDATTTGDSVAGSNPRTAFMVMALGNYGSSWWTSNPDSGYSVDNIAPAVPAPLTGQYGAGRVALHWDPNADADVAGYRVYRGTTPGFAIGAAALISAQPDTGLVDLSAVPAYYKVTAIDTHGNESAPASLLPAGTLAVGDAPLRASFSAPAPNPLRGGGASLLRFTLAKAGHTHLALYDAQGRLVRTLSDGALDAGAHAVRFDGRDDSGRALAPGLYLARIAAPGLSSTQRLLVID
jgi:hypothetical protein